jgi:hypothetical protein
MKEIIKCKNGMTFELPPISDRWFETEEQKNERELKYKVAVSLAPRTSFKEFREFVANYMK